MKTIATTLAGISLLLSGCVEIPVAPVEVADIVPFGSAGELMVVDSTLKAGTSREHLITAVTNAVKSQLTGGVETNAAINSSIAPAHYPLDYNRSALSAVDLKSIDPKVRKTAFLVDGKALTCTRPALVVHGANTDTDTTGEQVRIFACVMPFEGGFRTAVYASYDKGLMSRAMQKGSRFDGASFTKTAFGTIRSAIAANSSSVALVANAPTQPK